MVRGSGDRTGYTFYFEFRKYFVVLKYRIQQNDIKETPGQTCLLEPFGSCWIRLVCSGLFYYGYILRAFTRSALAAKET
jgi:hypothetical protein